MCLPPIRSRRNDRARRARTSISLRSDLLGAAKESVRAGEAENLSAFVESALEEKVARAKRAALYAAYADAARDQACVRDMQDVSRGFAHADRDGL